MLHSMIIDDFSQRFTQIRHFADEQDYAGFQSPVDMVLYPGICAVVPYFDVLTKLELAMGRPIEQYTNFMRLSTEGVAAPHYAHQDACMGDYSLMLYLNRPEHCQGGTALLRHMDGDPTPEVWARDTNRPEQWEVLSLCEMRPNRAFIFRSDLWHGALPLGGFGKDATDGRLVLTCFFS